MQPVVARSLISEAQLSAPNEVCGFIIDKGKTYLPIPNCHPQPTSGFMMEPDHMVAALLEHEHDLIGVYHSHPSGAEYPSPEDLPIMHHYAWMRFWIVTYKDVYEWKIVNGHARSCRRDGSLGTTGLVYPVLAPAEAIRRAGEPEAPRRSG